VALLFLRYCDALFTCTSGTHGNMQPNILLISMHGYFAKSGVHVESLFQNRKVKSLKPHTPNSTPMEPIGNPSIVYQGRQVMLHLLQRLHRKHPAMQKKGEKMQRCVKVRLVHHTVQCVNPVYPTGQFYLHSARTMSPVRLC